MARQRPRIPFPRIFMLHYKPSSQCQYFEAEEHEGYYVARCKVLGRYLVRGSVYKCERYWEDCPFRKIAVRMEEDKGQKH
ncbi:MAG: hypothetical protein F7C08_02250 [Desulfurococcales archaeon]|nr:hypothetical protein [Desulfurococcales archaeon]MCE4605340.1 hypothetical protein [Desulfurococcales archaeon]